MPDTAERAKIVVGVDGSPASIEALREAQRLAGALDADIEAISSWETPAVFVVVETEDFRQSAEQILAEAVLEAFGDREPDNLRRVVTRGPARETLIEASKTARMLVVGRRGRSRLEGWFVGSVSSACVARARCPVVVVPPPDDV